MIRRFDYGAPFDTHAVVQPVPVTRENPPHFTVSQSDAGLSFTLPLSERMMIFGLGESVRGINKRGFLYTSWNVDEFHHTQDKSSLYASHNFLLFLDEETCFGAFFDDPGRVDFDLGFTHPAEARISAASGSMSLYIIEAPTPRAVTRAFRGLIGRSYLPPRWAFGYMQSRWGYDSEATIREIVREHRSRNIPLDSVCMDIDYMDAFKDFTVHETRFPDLRALVSDMHDAHAQLVPIIDAGVKADGYPVCKEGLDRGYFCLRKDGTPFIGAVWPGRSYFPDFMRAQVRSWFGSKYHAFLDAGIEGFWNDMNEPSLFYSMEGLDKTLAAAQAIDRQDPAHADVLDARNRFARLNCDASDYDLFYHEVDGKPVCHSRIHNLYGTEMTHAAHDGLTAYNPDKRYLLFSRSSYVGAHRYGGVWQGDNHAWWDHLLLNLSMLPGLNMCGFLYMGADLGGFAANTTDDLMIRWLQLGIFTPLMRNHAACGTRDKEIYRFDLWETMRDVVTLRYALLPYLYSEFMKAALSDDCMFRPLAFDYPQDEIACGVEDQLMLGGECMIAPVYTQNARGRHVYLPEDMLMLRLRSATDYDVVPMEKGHHYVTLSLRETPLFIKKGCVIPLSRGGEWTDAVSDSELILAGWIAQDAAYALYRDDGSSTHVRLDDSLTSLEAKREGEGFSLFAEGIRLFGDALR